MTCKKCGKDKRIVAKYLCSACYSSEKYGYKTRNELILERNFERDGVGIFTTKNGFEFIVDIDIFHKYKNVLWWHDGYGYAVGVMDNKIDERLHRVICPEYKIVDHINKNKLDNRRQNLRDGSNGVNALNKTLDSSKTHSKVRGVYKMRDKWQVRLFSGSKRVYLGTYNTIDEAKYVLHKYLSENNLLEYYT